MNNFEKKAMREFEAQKQVKFELAKQAVAYVKGETKKDCYHPYRINHCGWKICITCGLYLRRLPIFFRMWFFVMGYYLEKRRKIEWAR